MNADSSSPPSLFDVTGRTFVITGGLGQLGAEFGRTLLSLGAHVAVLELDASPERCQQAFGARADEVLVLEADVTDTDQVSAALKVIRERWGVPHGLVNNAALDSPPGAPAADNGPFEGFSPESLDRVMSVNVRGTVVPCQVIGGAMAQEGRGSIINVSSIYGVVSPDQRIYEYRRLQGDNFYKPVAYSASKSAVMNLTRYLSTYWAASGVRVNTVTFAGVFNNQDEEFLSEYCKRVPLGRMAEAREYNGVVVFLLSDGSSYVTGSNVVVDGGWTAW